MKQYDLFLDGRSVRLSNALRFAIRDGDSEEAEIAYRELCDFEPSHQWLPHARTLVAALRASVPTNVDEALAELPRLEHEWTPAARAILGNDSSRMLARFWRRLGDLLMEEPFDPGQHDRHASYAYLKCEDWNCVDRCVRGVPDYPDHPVLLSRIAFALGRQGRWAEAASHWFELCWSAPDRFQSLMDRGEIDDALLCAAWDSALDRDVEPRIAPCWFPAWMLIHEPVIAGLIPKPAAIDSPRAAFAALQALTVGDGMNVGLRRQLQRHHPGLLKCFLAQQ